MDERGVPVTRTRLVGRDREAEEVCRLLGQTRLLTLAGAGGVGKTRLAQHVAQRFPAGGVCWVELASLEGADRVPQRIARAFGVPESPGRSIVPALVAHLTGWAGLLVLDNCEHLVAGCAATVDELLRAVPELRVLATSREPLGVAGEVSWPVPPLAVPDPAVELFVERAAATGYPVGNGDTEAVARLCRRLDGIPLAIELAAARMRVLDAATLLDRLDSDLGVLADRGRTAVPRHRTLTSTMDWSHDLLSADERVLFRRLSVFAGGFTLDAAEAVGSCGRITASRVLDLLSGLVEKSLIGVDRTGDTRYLMLQTVRQYAAAKLDEAGEAVDARTAHADHFVALAALAEPGLAGPDQPVWLRRLAADHDNVAAALGWLYERSDHVRGLELAGRLGRFWWYAGHFAEGAAWLEGFLGLPGAKERGPGRARALHALGLATFWHETPAAGVEAARTRFEEAAEIYRELGDEHRLATVLRDLGGYWKGAGDPAVARSVLGESIALARRLGDEYAVAAATVYLGVLAVYAGDLADGRRLLEGALAVLRTPGGGDELLRCLFFLACLECDAGDAPAARRWFGEVMALDGLAALPYSAGFALDGMALIAVVEGQAHRALRLAGAARVTHQRLGTAAGPAYDEYVRRHIEPVRRALGERVAERAYHLGRALPLADALAEGLRPPPVSGEAAPLTAREVDVLRLAADGLADAEIAARLHLSRRTVGNHLGAAYRKLGVGSRTAAIREARELGLL